MENSDLLYELKELVLNESQREFSPEEISNDEPLFGENSKLQLDSLDALQISVALNNKYGLKLTDSKDATRALSSIATLASYINSKK